MSFSLKKNRALKDIVAIYSINHSDELLVPFTKELLITFYYLSQFQYFTREQANIIYNAVSGKKLIQNKWFTDWVGNRTFPISKMPKKSILEKDILYINKAFGEWIVDTVTVLYSEYVVSFSEDQNLQKELFEFFSSYEYGKPRTISEHDFKTRNITIGVLSLLINRGLQNHTVAVTFPKNRRDTYILPDAIISYDGNLYYIEYDNYTETQNVLFNKVLTYSQYEQFKQSNIFFIFKSKLPEKSKFVTTRLSKFLVNVETGIDENSELMTKLFEKEISVYGFPLNESYRHIYNSIMLHCEREEVVNINTVSSLIKKESTILISDLSLAADSTDFEFYVSTQNDFYEDETIPVVILDYGKVGNNIYLSKLYDKYHNIYNRIGVLTNNHSYPYDNIPLSYDNYFINLAHHLGE